MKTSCSLPDCDKPARARGMCEMHYARWRKNGDPNVTRSRWDGHERKLNTCPVPGCGRQQYKTKLCIMHQTRLRKHGDASIVKPHRRKFFFKEDILDAWTPASAWLLGWIVTDGGIYDAVSPKVAFDLKDREAVELIARVVDHSEGPVENARGYHTLRLHSVRMVRRLAEWGIGPAKSLNVPMPPVPDDVLGHFARGVVEGDGTITKPPQIFRVAINSGSFDFLSAFRDRMPFRGSFFAIGLNTRKNPLHRLVYTGTEAMRFCEWIYRDSDGMRLGRKYQRYADAKGDTSA